MKLVTLLMTCCVLTAAAGVRADVVLFPNDYSGFVQAVGSPLVIDFQTLPDGSPSYAGAFITEDFNYNDQGAHFSSPNSVVYIAGNPVSGYEIRSQSPQTLQTVLHVDLTTPSLGAGAFFGGTTFMCAYDEAGDSLGCLFLSGGVSEKFIGLASDVPIHSVTFTDFSWVEAINDFVFAPIPEPASASLLMIGAWLLRRRPRGRRR